MSLKTKAHKLVTYFLFKLKSLSVARKSEKSIGIRIDTIAPNRRLSQIVTQFLYCGYTCYIEISFKQYINSDIYPRRAALTKNVFPARKSKKYDIFISDKREVLESKNAALKIFFDLHIFKNLGTVKEQDFFYPITMHPDFFSLDLERTIFAKAKHKHERKIAVLFIGNVDSVHYNNELTKKLFGINTRYKTFTAASEIPCELLYVPQSLEDFLQDMKNGQLVNKVVLLNINNFKIPHKLWFDILLETKFFIHMCGYIQPYCHNQIESMLAGCVPITQFKRFFIPHFEHGKNALVFETLDELKKMLVEIATSKYSENIVEMRKNILAYYQKHYSFQSFEKKLNKLLAAGIQETTYHIATGEEHILSKLEVKHD